MQTRVSFALFGFVLASCGTLVACGSEDIGTPPVEDVLLAPPPEGQGVQYQMTTRLEPGTEAEHCKFVQAPAEGMYVNRDEVRFTKGSHHFLLYETPYTSIPTETEDGKAVDTSGVFDCSQGATLDFAVTKLIAGSQNADGDAFLTFPSDVALRVEPGRVLLMNAHYINATSAPIEPEVRVNLFTIPAEQVKEQGDILFWYNPFIKVGAKSEARARMKCMVHTDIKLMNVQSHMHARGTGYAAALPEGAPFYTNNAWEGVPVKRFDSGMDIKAGTWIDYYCDYNNTGAADVYQGPRSTDEMCMLIGAYYPADPVTSNCAADPSAPDQTGNLGAEWIGNGTETCATTMGCVQQTFTGAGDVMQGITTCMMAADPAVSKEMSDALRCLFLNGQAAPTACKTQFDACLAK
ncbi:MAG: hypothetical protein HUU21_34870 [Polyangiaceae bacterium]|nr:hypothetical protein [Polyangiaceae bacterium]